MDLALVHAELVMEIRNGLPYVGSDSVAALSDLFEELGEQLEALGICHLLEHADTLEYRENLLRAGHGRRYFLHRSAEQGNDRDRRLALSRTRAVLDAVAAGALDLAASIAALSIDRWEKDWEYEDDFCFYAIVQGLVRSGGDPSAPELRALLARFDRALEGAVSARYDVCAALLDRDAAALSLALERRLEEEAEALDRERTAAHVVERDLCFWPRSQLSIEGLAILKLGELCGAPLPGLYPRCPALARLPTAPDRSRDLFFEVERLR